MSKYIDYDAIDYCHYKLHDKSSEFLDGVIYMAERIEDAPSIDIVRCGECKLGGTEDCPMDEIYSENFCSYGERKDEPQAIAEDINRRVEMVKKEWNIRRIEDEPQTEVETMSCQECKHFHENAVMYLDQCDFCFKDCKYEPKTEPQTERSNNE